MRVWQCDSEVLTSQFALLVSVGLEVRYAFGIKLRLSRFGRCRFESAILLGWFGSAIAALFFALFFNRLSYHLDV
jgi:hypothetical protein